MSTFTRRTSGALWTLIIGPRRVKTSLRGIPTRSYSNKPTQLLRLAKNAILPVASLDVILIRLRGSADWSAPFVVRKSERLAFSRRGPYIHRAKNKRALSF